MGSLWFLSFSLKCIDLLAWPLLALGYPMCASIRAIETDSYSETKNLIPYWILLSLIYLFEYTFLKLLEWFQFWPYLKLIIVFWLVIPDFGRALYVYNHLVRSCISMNPQIVISRFNNWKKLFVRKENFLLQAEKYIKENGTEALEQLIAGKSATHCLKSQAINAILAADQKEMQQNTACCLAGEAVKPVPATERKEMPPTNGKGLHLEQKDIKDLEMIEKKEVPALKNGNPVFSNLPLKENTPSSTETEGVAGKDAADEELPNCSVPKKVQKEWTCAICQLTTQSEINLNAHLHSAKHRAKCDALKAKNQPTSVKFVPAGADKKTDQSNGKSEMPASSSSSKHKNVWGQYINVEERNPQTYIAKEQAQPNSDPGKSALKDAIGQKTTTYRSNEKSEGAESSCSSKQKNVMNQHVKTEQKNAQTCYIAKEQARSKSEPDKSTLNAAMKKKTTLNEQHKANGGLDCVNAPANKSGQPNAKSEENIINNGWIKGKTVTDHEHVGMNQSNWTCIVCNVTCKNEADFATHLNGRRHLACIQSPAAFYQSNLTCIICNVKCTSESDLISHLNGRMHLGRIQDQVWGIPPVSGWVPPPLPPPPVSGWDPPLSAWFPPPHPPLSGWDPRPPRPF